MKNIIRAGLFLTPIVLICVSVIYRFWNLGIGSYWFDELYSIIFAKQNLLDLLLGKYYDTGKPPLHYLILGLWIRLFGEKEAATRALFAMVNCGAVVVFYIAAKTITHKKHALLWATALFAIAFVNVWAAREVRYYSLLLLFSTISFIPYFQLQERKNTILYITVSALGLYTHSLYTILLFFQGAVFVLFHLQLPKRKFLVFLIPVVLYLPYIFQMVYFTQHGNYTSPFNTIGQYNEQIRGEPGNIFLLLNPLLSYPTLPTLISMSMSFVILCAHAISHSKLKREKELLSVVILLVASSVLFPLNRIVVNWYYYYYLLPGVFLVFVFIFDKIKSWYTVMFGTVFVSLFVWQNAQYMFKYQNYFNRWRFHEVASYINSHPDSLVVYDNCATSFVVQYYMNRNLYKFGDQMCGQGFESKNISRKDLIVIADSGNRAYWDNVTYVARGVGMTLKFEQFYPELSLLKHYEGQD